MLNSNNQLAQFSHITLQGNDASQFLQGQLTINVNKLGLSYVPTAISNLKGRIAFGLWIKKYADDTGKCYDVVISADCAESFISHVKKYAVFSQVTLSNPKPIFPCVMGEEPTFSNHEDNADATAWMTASIATGNYWITQATSNQFQPQELRLHQRGGVDYDKGCYLGQEVIARLYFKSAPKAHLHRVAGDYHTLQTDATALPMAGEALVDGITVVNVMPCADDDLTFEALVVARPQTIEQWRLKGLDVLDLPMALQADVARSV